MSAGFGVFLEALSLCVFERKMYRLEGQKSKKAAKTSSDLSFPRANQFAKENRIISLVKSYISVLTCVQSDRGVCLFLRTEAY